MNAQMITRQEWIVILVAITGFLIALFLYLSRKNSDFNNFLNKSNNYNIKTYSVLKNKLINMTFGDKMAAERLIELERKRMPNAPNEILIQAAIERLERDRL